jgi:hypothetical protein
MGSSPATPTKKSGGASRKDRRFVPCGKWILLGFKKAFGDKKWISRNKKILILERKIV